MLFDEDTGNRGGARQCAIELRRTIMASFARSKSSQTVNIKFKGENIVPDGRHGGFVFPLLAEARLAGSERLGDLLKRAEPMSGIYAKQAAKRTELLRLALSVIGA